MMKILLLRDKDIKTIDELYDYIKMIHGKSYLLELAEMIANEQGFEVVKREPEIKPCPYCGNKMEYSDFDWISHKNDYGADYWVFCFGCGMQGPSFETVEKAIEAWNSFPRDVVDKR